MKKLLLLLLLSPVASYAQLENYKRVSDSINAIKHVPESSDMYKLRRLEENDALDAAMRKDAAASKAQVEQTRRKVALENDAYIRQHPKYLQQHPEILKAHPEYRKRYAKYLTPTKH